MADDQRVCTVCGGQFSGRRDAATCSQACRQKAHRRRKRDVTETWRHHLGDGPKRRGGTGPRHPTVARDITADVLAAVADLGGRLRQVYLGALRLEDAPSVEDVDRAIDDTRAVLSFLQDIRQHSATGGGSPIARWDPDRQRWMRNPVTPFSDRTPPNGAVRGGRLYRQTPPLPSRTAEAAAKTAAAEGLLRPDADLRDA